MGEIMEGFSEYLPIVKDTVVTVAVLVGGIWALFRYGLSKSSSISLEVEMNCKQETIPDDPCFYIQTLISIKNVGGVSYRIWWGDDPPFSVTSVNISSNGTHQYGRTMYYYLNTPVEIYKDKAPVSGNINLTGIGSENVRYINFVSKIEDPGLYLLKLTIPIRKQKMWFLGLPISVRGHGNMLEHRFFFVKNELNKLI